VATSGAQHHPSTHWGHLNALVRVARQRLSHRLGGDSVSVGRIVTRIAASCLCLVGVGFLLVPFEVHRGNEADPGGVVLEMAFWFACLVAALQSFRIMETLYRTGDARALAPLPVRASSLFLYRLFSNAAESVGVVLGAALAFLPVLWRGDPGLYWACVWVFFAGGVLTLSIGFAVQLYAGVATVRGDNDFGNFGPASFAISPGVALGISVGIILLEKLVAEELLRGGMTKGAQFGLSVGAAVVGLSLVLAYRWFVRDFYRALAIFMEADSVVIDVGYEYFKGGAPQLRGWERLLSRDLIPLVRRDRLQYRRRFMLSRLLVWGAALGFMVLLLVKGDEAVSRGLSMAVPMLVISLFARPWGRLFELELEPGFAHTLPIDDNVQLRSKALVSLRETAELGVVFFFTLAIGIGLGFRGWDFGVGAAGLASLIPFSASTLLLVLARRRRVVAVLAGLVIVAGTAFLGSLTVFALLPLAIILWSSGALALRSSAPRNHKQSGRASAPRPLELDALPPSQGSER